MIVKIEVYKYNKYDILKKLTNELKKKNPINTKVDSFGIDIELNVKSFDEVITILAKYNEKTKIKLSIHNANEVRVYIEHTDANKLVSLILDN